MSIVLLSEPNQHRFIMNLVLYTWPRPGFKLASYFMYGLLTTISFDIVVRWLAALKIYEASVKPGRGHYTVPLMLLRTLPVTSTCPYGKNSTIVTGYQAVSGWSNLLPAGK